MDETDGRASQPLLRRAMRLKQEADAERRRADGARKREVAEFLADDTGRIEYLRTLADYPKRKPEDIVSLTRYRRSLGLDRLPRIMSQTEIETYGWALKEGAVGIDLPTRSALGASGDKVRFYAPQEVEQGDHHRPDAASARDRRIDTTDPAAMDAFVAAADGCDLDALDPMAEFAVSVSYGLDLPDDPAPPLPPAETTEQLYDALDRIAGQVDTIQVKIDTALKRQRASRGRDGRRKREEALRTDGPRREQTRGAGHVGQGAPEAKLPIQPDRDRLNRSAKIEKSEPERKAVTAESIMAMGTADVIRAVEDRTRKMSRKGNRRS